MPTFHGIPLLNKIVKVFTESLKIGINRRAHEQAHGEARWGENRRRDVRNALSRNGLQIIGEGTDWNLVQMRLSLDNKIQRVSREDAKTRRREDAKTRRARSKKS